MTTQAQKMREIASAAFDHISGEDYAALHAFADELERQVAQPIDMVLHCPACGEQHIDESEAIEPWDSGRWDNPPHRSHQCHECGYIWRPADVPTNGVAAVKTRGKNDSPITAPRAEVEILTDEQIASVIHDVAELPDRTSPDDMPDVMLVTAGELRDILRGIALKQGDGNG